MLLVQADVRNISNRSITPTLYICIVSEGTFCITGMGSATTNIGVISSEDILNASMQPGVNYYDVQEVNGGNFFSGLVNFGKDVGKRIWQGYMGEMAESSSPMEKMLSSREKTRRASAAGRMIMPTFTSSQDMFQNPPMSQKRIWCRFCPGEDT